jgi:hypothetical protein
VTYNRRNFKRVTWQSGTLKGSTEDFNFLAWHDWTDCLSWNIYDWLLYARWQPSTGIATDYINCLIESWTEHQTQEMAWLPVSLAKLLKDLNSAILDQLWITINPENFNKCSYIISKCLFYQLKDFSSIEYILLHVLFS